MKWFGYYSYEYVDKYSYSYNIEYVVYDVVYIFSKIVLVFF